MDYLDLYGVKKVLTGVIPGNKTIRQNWLQSLFGNTGLTVNPTINLDKEFNTGNVMGQPVAPRVDAPQIALPEFGHKEFSLAYTKERVSSDDFEEVNSRQIGQEIGMVDPMGNDAMRLRQKYGLALGAIENLFEYTCRDVLFTGIHTATSAYFPTMTWNFGKTIASTDTIYLTGNWGQADLTTLNGNGGVGKRAWGSTGGTKAVSPYRDFLQWVTDTRRRQRATMAIMSGDAFEQLRIDMNTTYKDAAVLTLQVTERIAIKVLPTINQYQGLTFQLAIRVGTEEIPIYTYDAVYNDRVTGVQTKYVPDGYVVLVPDSSNLIKRQGRIISRKAGYQPMEMFISVWENRRGDIEQEMECSYIFAPLDPDSVKAIKVM